MAKQGSKNKGMKKKRDLNDIEYERRVGYAWYGTWPKDLLEVKYPAWAALNLTKSTPAK